MAYGDSSMVNTEIDVPINVVARNIMLTGEIMRYLLEQPELFLALPSDLHLWAMYAFLRTFN